MKIKSIRLRDFKAFECAGIEDLSIDYNSGIQIVLGRNGSGKSSYLRQLGPYPVAKSFFQAGKKGLKEVVIEHNGSTYTLKSDFSEKSHPHSFTVEGGSELNDGGGTSVQADLVEKYFDLDKDKEKLLFGDIDVTSLGFAQRKAFLLKSSPLQLGFMIDNQKTLGSKIRGVKFELKSNSERESQLLDLLMTPEDLEELHKELKGIDDDLTTLVTKRGGLLERQRSLREASDDWYRRFSSDDFLYRLEAFKTRLREEEESFRNQHPDFVFSESAREDLLKKDSSLGSSIENENRHLEDICSRLRKVETELEKTDGRQFAELEQQKLSLEKEIHDLKQKLSNKSFSLKDVEGDYHSAQNRRDLESILTPLVDCLKPLSFLTNRLITREQYRQEENKLESYKREIGHLNANLEGIDRELQELGNLLKRYESLGDVSPCAKNECPLYRHATNNRNQRQERYNQLEAEKEKIEEALKRLKEECETLHERLSDLAPAMESLGQLQRLTERAPVLSRYIGADILEKLSNSPSWLSKRVSDDIDYSSIRQQEETLLSEIKRIDEKLSAQKSISSEYREVQLKEKDSLEEQWKASTDKKSSLKASSEDIKRQLSSFDTYLTLEKDKKTLEEQLQAEKEYTSIAVNTKKVETDLKELGFKFSELTSKKGSLDHTLGEQTKLRSQYEGEIKRRKEELLVMQQELAVADESLKKLLDDSVRGWLERLTDQVNKYIASVFTYRLEVKVPAGPIDFRFSMKAKDTDVPDIGMGSTAQKEMINLAFCLALRDEFKMYDYPIFLDETGRTFDPTHQFKIVGLLNALVQEKFVSQLILINHHASIHGGLNNAQTLVLDSENIDLPPNYNEGVNIE